MLVSADERTPLLVRKYRRASSSQVAAFAIFFLLAVVLVCGPVALCLYVRSVDAALCAGWHETSMRMETAWVDPTKPACCGRLRLCDGNATCPCQCVAALATFQLPAPSVKNAIDGLNAINREMTICGPVVVHTSAYRDVASMSKYLAEQYARSRASSTHTIYTNGVDCSSEPCVGKQRCDGAAMVGAALWTFLFFVFFASALLDIFSQV
jgi:hypothetical protein